MRHVAVAVLIVVIGALLPQAQSAPLNAYDQCEDSISAASPCLRAETPATPARAAARYFIWLAGTSCAPAFNASCSGRSTDVPGPAPVKFVGLLYEDTNGLPGLQRLRISTSNAAADSMVLV